MTQEPGNDAPSFITECFFLTHILISLITKKLEQQYEQISKAVNKAAGEKDIASYEEFMGQKLSIDAMVCGKNTLQGFRQLLTFSGALFIAMNNYEYYAPEFFSDIEVFQRKVMHLPIEPIANMPLDIAAFPTCVLNNLSTLPRMFRQMQSEAYLGKEIDLHIQLATNVAVILNKRIKNPHIRAEMIKFLAYLVPHQAANKHQPRNQRQEREDNLYKDVFFASVALREWLMEALVVVYIDAERTGYYEKASFRYYASMIMEFVWQDPGYREHFMLLGALKPGLFIEFCNFLINDLNNLLFDGLLELEEIRSYEEL